VESWLNVTNDGEAVCAW